MTDVIGKLLSVEKEVDSILGIDDGDSNSETSSLDEVIDKVSSEIRIKVESVMDCEISKLRERMSLEKNERIDEIDTKADSFIGKIKNEFDINKDKWIQDIFNEVLEDS